MAHFGSFVKERKKEMERELMTAMTTALKGPNEGIKKKAAGEK